VRTDLTDITIILDRSGSMEGISSDAIGGVNAFLEDQAKAPTEANVTLTQFDNEYEVVYSGRPVKEAPKLTRETYHPRGSTSLYDAICRTIDETGKRLEAIAEDQRPGLVIVAIVTDGYENSSKMFSIHDVNERITRQRDQWQWQILFLAANQDAIATAAHLGINAANAISWGATARGTRQVMNSVSSNVRSARASYAVSKSVGVAGQSLGFTDEQRDEQKDEIAKKAKH